MAIQPPAVQPGPPAAQVPPARRSGCAGCSISCLGCLGVIVIVIILLLGGGYFFLIAQAQAGVPSPASLLVVSAPVDVGKNDSGYTPATSGQSLSAGNSVRTGHTGHATIQFPDGSLTRLSPDTTVTVQAAQLGNSGGLKSATLQQKVGRTLSEVQHLAGGASFQVAGHSVGAEVRGTQFEVLVRPDGSNQIKVFEGTVQVTGKTTITLNAGEQVDASPDGTLGTKRSIQPDPNDPFALVKECVAAVAPGMEPGTLQVTSGQIANGQTAEVDYRSAGGVTSAALCYAGGFINLSVVDPLGTVHAARSGQPPIEASTAGPPGLYKALAHAINVPGGSEAFVVAFANNAPCVSGNVDTGAVVRQTLSNTQLQQGLASSGVTGVTIKVVGISSTSATIYYYSSIGGSELSWTIDFYAATPNLGWVLTQITVRGINLTTQVMDRLTASGAAVSSIPQDYIVDRVYSCSGEGGMMVIEGHRV